MMKLCRSVLVLGTVAFVASFMPVAARGILFVSIEHLGMLSKALYVLPLAVVWLSFRRDCESFVWLLKLAGALGIVLTALTVWGGMQHLALFSSGIFGSVGKLAMMDPQGDIFPGYGGITLVLAYVLLTLAAYRESRLRASEQVTRL